MTLGIELTHAKYIKPIIWVYLDGTLIQSMTTMVVPVDFCSYYPYWGWVGHETCIQAYEGWHTYPHGCNGFPYPAERKRNNV